MAGIGEADNAFAYASAIQNVSIIAHSHWPGHCILCVFSSNVLMAILKLHGIAGCTGTSRRFSNEYA